jgi:hypothetical protein
MDTEEIGERVNSIHSMQEWDQLGGFCEFCNEASGSMTEFVAQYLVLVLAPHVEFSRDSRALMAAASLRHHRLCS